MSSNQPLISSSQQHLEIFPVAIIGIGLIGGSIAKRLTQQHIPVLAYDPVMCHGQTLTSDNSGDISWYPSLPELLIAAEKRSALIVVAVPLTEIPTIFSAIADHTRQCSVTDVTSVKSLVHILADQYGLAARFIGSHPMAGTEFSGWNASKAELFIEKKWVITTTNQQNNPTEQTLSKVLEMVGNCGAIPMIMDPVNHDHTVAITSHLPHIFSDLLSISAQQHGLDAYELAAGSFADATRVSRTRAKLVHAMLTGNAAALIPAIDQTIAQLQHLRTDLQSLSLDPPEQFSTTKYSAFQNLANNTARELLTENSSSELGYSPTTLNLDSFVLQGYAAKQEADNYHSDNRLINNSSIFLRNYPE